MERMVMAAGPISIEIIEPLHMLRIRLEPFDGISADITFTGRAFPIEEPRFTHRIGPRAFMDYTRLTQNGRYTGWIEVDGTKRDLAAGTMGTRDSQLGLEAHRCPRCAADSRITGPGVFLAMDADQLS